MFQPNYHECETKRDEMMKKSILTITAAMLLAGCGAKEAAPAASDGLFKAGTYTASAAGRNGDIKVTAVFTDNEIKEITYESQETETIGVPAMDQLIESILSSQTLDLDTVSGATISSEAFLKAMADNVTQAGADPENLKGNGSESASKETEYETEADIIVVGGALPA
jgi:fumarate reductase flavoprotein subunit